LEHYAVRYASTPTDPHEPFVTAYFRKPLEYYGYLCFSLHGERGGCLSPPAPKLKKSLPSGWVRLCKRLGGQSAASEVESAAAIPADRYEQEQLFVETAFRLPHADLADLQQLFFQTRARLRQR
jgi:hypothetical protein